MKIQNKYPKNSFVDSQSHQHTYKHALTYNSHRYCIERMILCNMHAQRIHTATQYHIVNHTPFSFFRSFQCEDHI